MDQKLNTSWVENNTAEQHGEPHWIYICWESGPHNWLGASVWCCCPEVELYHISTEKCQISKFKAWFLLSVCQFFLVMSQIEQNFLYMPGKDSTELHPQPIFILLPLYSPRQGFSVQLWLFWNTICGQGWPQNHTQIKKKKDLFTSMCACLPVCVCTQCSWRPEEGIGSFQTGCRQLLALMWLLGTKSSSSAKEVSVLKYWPIP